MDKKFYDLLVKRRSIYALSNKITLSEKDVSELVKHALKYAPTAFNSQSGRIIALYNKNHKKFWDITLTALEKVTPPERFPSTVQKISSFAAGFGTLLFFEDEKVVLKLQQEFPLYKDKFPEWSLESNGMLQFAVWCLLADNDIGASLQHYSPLIDDEVRRQWKISDNWKLIAQMPFGHIEKEADEKTFLPLDERIRFYN